jgi:uncharacterized protein DUF1565
MRARARVIVFGAWTMAGCGGDEAAPPSCAPPNRDIGGRCIEPGVQDDGCPAGTLGLPDGACQSAGIPPEACSDGFVHDGDVGCVPVLPDAPCPAGEMALPGETVCRPVASCAPGKWGDIPVDAATEYVDASSTGASDGSAAAPWHTISQALVAATPGATIAVAAGHYQEDLRIEGKPVRLRGVCPSQTELAGTGAVLFAVDVGPGADGTELSGLAVTGPGVAVGVSGAHDVVLDQLWVHDALDQGVDVEDAFGPTSVTLRRSLIAHNHEVGVFVMGAAMTVEDVVVVDSQPVGGRFGRGLDVEPGTTPPTPSSVTVRRTVLDDNHEIGLFLHGSEATVEDLVVRGTLPQPADLEAGHGVTVQDDATTGLRGTLAFRGGMVERSHDVGVFVGGSDATLERVVVRATLPSALDATGGVGVYVVSDPVTSQPGIAVLRTSLVEDNHTTALYVGGSDATVEGVVLRRTLPQESDGASGRGIHVRNAEQGGRGSARIRGSIVDANHDVGVFVGGSDVSFEGSIVSGTLPRAFDGSSGSGLIVQVSCEGAMVADCPNPQRSTVSVSAAVLADNHETAMLVVVSDATVDAVVARATKPRPSDGAFGDGVAVAAALIRGVPYPASAIVTRMRVAANGRAGIASFGGTVTVADVELSCNGFDLEGEVYAGIPFTFDDVGGNQCGCPDPTGVCVARSVGLAPPDSDDR